MSFKKDKRLETLVYLGLWLMLFIAPVLTLSIRITNDSSQTFNWREVLMVWREYLPFLLAFLIHNHLVAPQLVYRQKRVRYFLGAALITAIFIVWQQNHHPIGRFHHNDKPMKELRAADAERPPMPPEFESPEGPEFDNQDGPEFGDRKAPSGRPPFARHNRDDHRPPVMIGQHDIISVVILILMLGMNIAVKLYIKQRGDQRKLVDMEHKNLEQQLEYLKYQLNPHFLMNTLNNIHALVDIDPELAKQTILNFSKLMRYVLYESNKPTVPIQKEREFMDNYCTLMRLRYSDRLQFSEKHLDDDSGIMIPPLLFITFVENAFKHGVSYREDSYIAIETERMHGSQGQERLVWTCRNSLHQQIEQTSTGLPRQGGVGLENVRRRLDIIYGDEYQLDTSQSDSEYKVRLTIPI